MSNFLKHPLIKNLKNELLRAYTKKAQIETHLFFGKTSSLTSPGKAFNRFSTVQSSFFDKKNMKTNVSINHQYCKVMLTPTEQILCKLVG